MIKFLTAVALSSSLLLGASFSIDKSHSQVGFSVKHMMISNVKGKFNEYDGDIEFDTKTNKFEELSAEIETESVDTDIKKRDNHLRSNDFFNAEKYPVITFTMKEHNVDSDQIIGDLTIRDVTKSVKLNLEMGGIAKDPWGSTRIGFSLYGKIKRKDFGLKWNKAMEAGGFVVGETVKIMIEIEGIQE